MSDSGLPDLDELEAKARMADEMSAVPDDWYRASSLERVFHSREEAEFVAAASPSSVLALIERVRELREALDRCAIGLTTVWTKTGSLAARELAQQAADVLDKRTTEDGS